MITTALTDMFGLDHPIVLAPMGGVSEGAWPRRFPTPADWVWLVAAMAILRGCGPSCRAPSTRPRGLGAWA